MAETKKAVPKRGADNDGSAMRIDPALVRELAELLTQNALTEIEVADGDRRIKVARGAAAAAAPASAAAPAAAASAAASSPQAAPEQVADNLGVPDAVFIRVAVSLQTSISSLELDVPERRQSDG